MHFPLLRLTWPPSLLSIQLLRSSDELWTLSIVPQPGCTSLPVAWKADYIRYFYYGGGSNLLLTGIDIFLDMHLLFLSSMILSGTSLTGLMNIWLSVIESYIVVSSIMVMLVSITKKMAWHRRYLFIDHVSSGIWVEMHSYFLLNVYIAHVSYWCIAAFLHVVFRNHLVAPIFPRNSEYSTFRWQTGGKNVGIPHQLLKSPSPEMTHIISTHIPLVKASYMDTKDAGKCNLP